MEVESRVQSEESALTNYGRCGSKGAENLLFRSFVRGRGSGRLSGVALELRFGWLVGGTLTNIAFCISTILHEDSNLGA